MKALFIDLQYKEAFKMAADLEAKFPKSEWRYFNPSDDRIEAIFEILGEDTPSSEYSIQNLHKDFFTTFFGLFSTQMSEDLKIESQLSFVDFCEKINAYLISDVKIYDFSRKSKWIWSEQKELKVPQKLKSFLSTN